MWHVELYMSMCVLMLELFILSMKHQYLWSRCFLTWNRLQSIISWKPNPVADVARRVVHEHVRDIGQNVVSWLYRQYMYSNGALTTVFTSKVEFHEIRNYQRMKHVKIYMEICIHKVKSCSMKMKYQEWYTSRCYSARIVRICKARGC